MHCNFLQVIAALVGLTTALPTPAATSEPSSPLDAAGNTNTTLGIIGPRANPTAPQDRLIIDQMKTDGLPKCYFDCMVDNREWLQADLYKDNLHTFCEMPGFWETSNWLVYHVQFCIPHKCGINKEAKEASDEWMKRTCDRHP